MSRPRFFAALLVFGLLIGCKAQTPPNSPSAELNRRVEVLVRSRFQLPTEVSVTIGARTPSNFPGYQTLPVTISLGTHTQTIDFLISNDGSKLVHLDNMDLTTSPEDQITLKDRPVRGNPGANVTVVSFDDLECPYCSRMHQELFPATLDRYKDKVRFVYKDDPLVEIHPWAMHAAVDANCLAAQNSAAYWTYVDYLHDHGDEITGSDRSVARSEDALDHIARQQATAAKLDGVTLDACIAKQDQAAILASRKEAEALDIQGTPALFVNGERINGLISREALWTVIDRALRAKGEIPPPDSPPASAAPAGTGN